MEHYKTMAVALKPKEDAGPFLTRAAEIARARKIHVILCSVIDAGMRGSAFSYRAADTDREKAEQTEVLTRAADYLRGEGVSEVSVYVGIGSPRKVLAHDVSDIFHPDLILCGDSTGRLRDKPRHFGNVANYILHFSDCDVLVIR
ncbi:MAG: universal stress protein [Eubacteriales bacterium]|nr:universal stress protein [Eubacteriales bacterium]